MDGRGVQQKKPPENDMKLPSKCHLKPIQVILKRRGFFHYHP